MAKTQTSTKIKKKRWFQIVAPDSFKNAHIGEILLGDIISAEKRHVSVNLMTLTNDIKKQNINVKFKMDKIKGDKIVTSFVGYDILPSSIRRMIRRRRNRIDMSFLCQTSDNVYVRIKPIILTRFLVKKSLETELSKITKNRMIARVKKMTFEQLANAVVFHKLQQEFYNDLNKIYPLRNFELKSVIIETPKKKVEIKAEEIVEKKEEDEGEKDEIVKKEEAKKEEKEPVKEEPKQEEKSPEKKE